MSNDAYLRCINLFGHTRAAEAAVKVFTAESVFIHSAVVFLCTSVLFCVRLYEIYQLLIHASQ